MNTQELNTVLTRIQNAKRCTESLLEKTKSFANFIQEQMEDLGVDRLMNGKYVLRTIRASVGSDTSLYLKTSVDCGYDWLYVCLDVSSIDAERDSYLLWGDYNASYNKPNRADIFEFIGDAETLLIELAELDKAPNTEVLEKSLTQSRVKVGVLLDGGTCGTLYIDADKNPESLFGEIVNVELADENGNRVHAKGMVVEILSVEED
ncbi:hypothetical protein [Vibrio navarrensis]|uniref:hypothetical protein n=1 Tax=Vibrio navarrensis TaxID=29495 RepID=UPI001559D85C|nr:hypothetical protein [Vibrio navarrensis]